MRDYAALRRQMVNTQLAARGIQDPDVLEAMSIVPREAFVPADSVQVAYADSPLPIGQGQTISQLYIVALMTEALELLPDDRALEIGTGSGYAAAVLSRIAYEVYTVERHPRLARAAEALFRRLGYDNIHVRVGKYLSYLLFTVVLTLILTGLLALTIHLPNLDNWAHYILAIAALLFASLGIGFVLSLLAQTRSQGVQYSMLVLLTSVFFTGFFLNLELLRPSVRVISRVIPASYAIWLLQDIMLRGRPINLMWVGILTAIGAGLFLVAWFLLRRAMDRV